MVTKKKAERQRLELEETMRELDAPPRRVSLSVWVGQLTSTNGEILGWLFACAGMFMVCMTLNCSHMADTALVNDWRNAGQAKLVSCAPARGFKDTRRHIFEVTEGHDETRTETCFSKENMERLIGTSVPVEYCGKYDVYRIVDTSVGVYPDGGNAKLLACVLVALPLLGLGMVLRGFYYGARILWFLKYGEVAVSKKCKVRMRNEETGRRESTLVFEYKTLEGETFRHELPEDGMLDLRRDEQTPVFYDKRSPWRYSLRYQWRTFGISMDPRSGKFQYAQTNKFVKMWVAFLFYILFLGFFIYLTSYFWGGWSLV